MCLSLKVIDPALNPIVYNILLLEHEYGAFGHEGLKLMKQIGMKIREVTLRGHIPIIFNFVYV